MAALDKTKERTVAFYEIVAKVDGAHARIGQISWADLLSQAAQRPVEGRTVSGDSTLVGNVVTYDEEDHLLLHRVKDDSEWLSIVNWETGEVKELERRAAEGLLDTSVVCFLPFGNVFALMQGAIASPTHTSLSTWLNGIKAFEGPPLAARPLITRSEVERLRSAEGASRVEIRVGANRIGALENRNGRLARVLRQTADLYGDISVTLIISVPQGKTRGEDRQALLNDLRDLGDVMPMAAERAQATLVYADESGPEGRRLVQFVEHHLTAKARVRSVDDEGNALRISSAVSVILNVAASCMRP